MAVEEVTYFSNKNSLACPVCGTKFEPEILREGRGRLSAGDLTDELRRLYIPTKKYGKVNPLLYPVIVCPNCLYAAEKADFMKCPSKTAEKLLEYQSVRAKYVIKIFGRVPDYLEKRDLVAGATSHILAMSSYSFFDPRKFSPSIKTALAGLRGAWLMNDLLEETKDAKYGELAKELYKKSSQFYDVALANQSDGSEPLDNAPWLGPGMDNNFGYDGFLYVTAILRYKVIGVTIEDPFEKLDVYEGIKRILSKVFGIGRKARDKPQDLLNLAREAYDKIGEEQKELESQLEGMERPESENPAEEEVVTEEEELLE